MMFRFDHDASPQGVGGHRVYVGWLTHRSVPPPYERVVAPAIYWPRRSGVRVQVLAWERKNQMSD